MIRIDSVYKSFNQTVVLNDIQLSFAPKKTHILLGASGSGKSTLLKMIMGLISPDQGSIWLDQEKMTPSSQRLLAQKMGYVLQDGGLFPHLNARQNIALMAETLGWSSQQIQNRIDELIEVVSLDHLVLGKFPRQLSGGEKQRVAVMRAAFLNPNVILLDEPLGALDPLIRSSLQKELRSIFEKLQKLVIMVTHDIGEAAFFGHTVTLLYQGRVLQHGSFSELLHAPTHPYVTEFIQAQRTLHDLGDKI